MHDFSILIVDDSEEDRYILKRYLKEIKSDLKIFEKEDGADAIDFLKNYEKNKEMYSDLFPPQIIFVDINMPSISGLTFLNIFSELKQQDEYKDGTIIMYTSSEKESDKEESLSYNFVKGYLIKSDISTNTVESIIGQAIA